MSNYDMTDPLIRELVRMHVPTETFGPTGSVINCARCNQPWPCEARLESISWEKQQEAEAKAQADALAAAVATAKAAAESRNG